MAKTKPKQLLPPSRGVNRAESLAGRRAAEEAGLEQTSTGAMATATTSSAANEWLVAATSEQRGDLLGSTFARCDVQVYLEANQREKKAHPAQLRSIDGQIQIQST